ncbi:AMP phosphorylase [Candidatus Norongarragalina meridionalis]|nr:AMP phosphorylase [Candidatus Norongarragalina meridionalis]
MEFKARIFDVEQGQNEVALNEQQAKEIDLALLDRVKVRCGKKESIALVDYSHSVTRGEIGLFREVAEALGVSKGQLVSVEMAKRPSSLDFIRKKLDGEILSQPEVSAIIDDLMAERLSSAELAAFIVGVYTKGMSAEETVSLTNAIYASGGSLHSKKKPVVSEHSIGGVAGDRCSMLVVPIIASLGLTIPKTCTRAISSASGSADAMEVIAPVTLSLKDAERVVDKTGGCLIWGGAVNMAAADDKLIKIRNPLRLDPKPLLLSSILAKKKAEGAQYVLLDLPVGRGAKLASIEEARDLAKDFEALGRYLGMQISCSITDGSEPLINTIGPAFEARAVLEALYGKSSPLADKACVMSGVILSMVRGITREEGAKIAKQQLVSGRALAKFKEIAKEQGGNPDIKPEDIRVGKYVQLVKSKEEGKVAHVDNRCVSRVCRALGAPSDKQAGMLLRVAKGQKIEMGAPLFELYASSKEKLDYGIEQMQRFNVVEIERIIIDVV